MVRIHVTENQNKILIEFLGHAGYDKKGKDIVCAGISAISQYLVIHFFETLKLEGNFHISDGNVFIEIDKENNVEMLGQVYDTIKSLKVFSEILNTSYPSTVEINFTNVDNPEF